MYSIGYRANCSPGSIPSASTRKVSLAIGATNVYNRCSEIASDMLRNISKLIMMCMKNERKKGKEEICSIGRWPGNVHRDSKFRRDK